MKLINNKFKGFRKKTVMWGRRNCYFTIPGLPDLCGTRLELGDVGLIVYELALQLQDLLLTRELFPVGAVSLHRGRGITGSDGDLR